MKAIIKRIPSGMHRSVENAAPRAQQHPVRDASLTGCAATSAVCSSTERHSLTGMAPTHRKYQRSYSGYQRLFSGYKYFIKNQKS